MGGSGIEEKGDSLREAFFEGQARGLGEALRQEEDAALYWLAEASGIREDALLQRLAGFGIRAETLAALSLAPLVEVAWADGDMDEKERDAILRGAATTGIEESSWSYRLLQIWIEERPSPDLFLLWSDFAKALASQLAEAEREAFRSKIVGRTRDVAEAAGGILGFGSISRVEQSVLDQVASLFTPDRPASD